MNTCDEDIAKQMGKSLLDHARDIHNYARCYCEKTACNDYLSSDDRARFIKNLERMLKDMYALMLLAKYKGVSRFCNREQIEAYIEAAADIMATPAESVLDFEALLN